MDDRKTEVFSSAFPCQYLIITLEQGIEVGLAKAEWDGMHEDHQSITYNHEWSDVFVSILLGMVCLESTEKIQNRWGSVVAGHIRSCWKRGGTLIWVSDHQFIYVKRTCAVFSFLHNASCCIEIHYVFFTSLVEYVNAFLWPKHHTLWMKDHLLDNLIRFIFFSSTIIWRLRVSFLYFLSLILCLHEMDLRTSGDGASSRQPDSNTDCFRFSIFLR